ncbi:MAG: heme lyase CcmF/NrfE family subunit [Chloroflexi bacterium]|nr:heme lyase CcmF/NrfE family subunit [Chloroflexota bacterium]
MSEVGYIALIVGIVVSAYAVFALVIGGWKGYPELLASGKNAALAVAGLVVLGSAILFYSLLVHDFSLTYVYDYTSSDLSPLYTISAFWAGQEGSLLFWALLLSIFIFIVSWQFRERQKELMPYVLAIMTGLAGFFIAMSTLVTNVFAKEATVPTQGYGLNPLLQNPGMMFHPPTLYLGYVGVTVPFAFGIAALITGRLNDKWIRDTRSWILLAWFFLTLGNIIGGQWAYTELGWGGYWAWDPVENSSLMPWLTLTAFMHSVMIQQRRGMFKVWNIALIVITFGLSLFGTYLVRSGVLSSVHSFAPSSLGTYFMLLIIGVVILSVILVVDRFPMLRGESDFGSVVSRESSFLLNNLVLAGSAFAVFWGTVYPLIAQALQGKTVSVDATFFNTFNGPIFLVLVVLMGVCPLIAWQKASADKLLRKIGFPAVVGVVAGVVAYVLGAREIYAATIPIMACGFVAATLLYEFGRGVWANSRRLGTANLLRAAGNMVARNKPRYGGYLVHMGIILLVVGVIGSTTYKVEKDVTLSKGQTTTIGGYTLKYEGLSQVQTTANEAYEAKVVVYNQAGQQIDTMLPKKEMYQNQDQPYTEVAIRSTLSEDLYLILGGWDTNGASATFKVLINPLIMWIWIGGVVLSLGALISMWPGRQEARRLESRFARELAARKEAPRQPALSES